MKEKIVQNINSVYFTNFQLVFKIGCNEISELDFWYTLRNHCHHHRLHHRRRRRHRHQSSLISFSGELDPPMQPFPSPTLVISAFFL